MLLPRHRAGGDAAEDVSSFEQEPDVRPPGTVPPRGTRVGGVRGAPAPTELVPASPGYANSAMVPGPDAMPGGRPIPARQPASGPPAPMGRRIPYANEPPEMSARLDAEHAARVAAARPDAAPAPAPVSPIPPSGYQNESAEQTVARLEAHRIAFEAQQRAATPDAAPPARAGSSGGYQNSPAPPAAARDAAPRPGDVYRTISSRYEA